MQIDSPVSPPAQVAAAEGELHSSAKEFALEWLRLYHLHKPDWTDGEYPKLNTLTEQFEAFGREVRSTILARLTATESARDEAVAERDEALKELGVAWLTHSAAVLFKNERDAALARAERLEKALRRATDELEEIVSFTRTERCCLREQEIASIAEVAEASRVALAQPAPAEET